MLGGAGNDDMVGGGGGDTLRGFDQNDFLNGLDEDDQVVLDLGNIFPANFSTTVVNAVDGEFGSTLTAAQLQAFGAESASAGTPQPDLLDGGNGNDILLGNAGDRMIGGAGVDQFRVVNGPGAAVVITDVSPTTEDIVIYVNAAPTSALTFVNVTGGVELRLGSETVAMLNGTTAASPRSDDLRFG